MTSMLLCIDLAPSAQCGQGARELWGRGLCVGGAQSVVGVAFGVVGICDIEGGDSRVRREPVPLLPSRGASLRRPTEPLRGPIGRRLAKGTCSPPSIPLAPGAAAAAPGGLSASRLAALVASSAAFAIAWRRLP